MPRWLVLCALCTLLQDKPPTPVKASFDLTWKALTDVVRGDLANDRLIVAEEGAGFRKARWLVRLAVTDPRAGSWATCQGGGDPPVAPRSGVVDAEVRGDSVAATVTLTVVWSGIGPNDVQRALTCRSYGEYEKQVASDVRKKAEKAAAHH
jgi:hypothetical protein